MHEDIRRLLDACDDLLARSTQIQATANATSSHLRALCAESARLKEHQARLVAQWRLRRREAATGEEKALLTVV